jgi:hypothetical protein
MTKIRYKYKKLINSVQTKTPVGKKRAGKENNLPLVIDGIQISRVTLPKVKGHSKDIPVGTMNSIRNQLLLRNDQFIDFINCPMTKSDYINILKKKFAEYFPQ